MNLAALDGAIVVAVFSFIIVVVIPFPPERPIRYLKLAIPGMAEPTVEGLPVHDRIVLQSGQSLRRIHVKMGTR